MSPISSGATFILGGARSGKSRFAEQLVVSSGLEHHYVATGRAWDDEMRARIDKHKADRGDLWHTHEEPLDLVGCLRAIDGEKRAVLVDCLTLWITNLLGSGQNVAEAVDDLVATLPAITGTRVILVSNEVGLGIVPDNAMARMFRDLAAVATLLPYVVSNSPRSRPDGPRWHEVVFLLVIT